MIETSAKLKFILFVDAVLFILCTAGLISIYQKAKLPFELTEQDSLLTISVSQSNYYGLSTGDKLISVDGLNVSLIEKIEFITDRKNIGEEIFITVLTKSGAKNLAVPLTNYYSTFYLISTVIVALFFSLLVYLYFLKIRTESFTRFSLGKYWNVDNALPDVVKSQYIRFCFKVFV